MVFDHVVWCDGVCRWLESYFRWPSNISKGLEVSLLWLLIGDKENLTCLSKDRISIVQKGRVVAITLSSVVRWIIFLFNCYFVCSSVVRSSRGVLYRMVRCREWSRFVIYLKSFLTKSGMPEELVCEVDVSFENALSSSIWNKKVWDGGWFRKWKLKGADVLPKWACNPISALNASKWSFYGIK